MDCSIGFSPTEKILARLIKENSVNSTETGKLPLDQYGDVMEHWFYFRKHDRPDYNAGLGCTYKLNKQIFFDLLGVIDLNKNDNQFGISFGLCWFINNQ